MFGLSYSVSASFALYLDHGAGSRMAYMAIPAAGPFVAAADLFSSRDALGIAPLLGVLAVFDGVIQTNGLTVAIVGAAKLGREKAKERSLALSVGLTHLGMVGRF